MSAVTLYEIADARMILSEWLDESDGEVTPELEALLAETDADADKKIERVALFIRECQVHADAVKAERDRLAALVKREEKAADSLKRYLLRQLDRLGKSRVECGRCTVAVQKNSQPSVTSALTDEQMRDAYFGEDNGELPGVEQFIREEPVSYRLDRDAVLMAYGAGDPIPAAIVVDHGFHVRIR